MPRISNWMSALVLVVVMSNYCYSQNSAPITIVLTPNSGLNATGVAIDADPESLVFPATFDVLEDPSGALQLTIESVSSNTPSATVNGTFLQFSPFLPPLSSFGVDSEGVDTSTQFESDFEEELEISFNQSLFIEQIDLNGLDDGETFSVGGVDILNAGLPFTDIFDFTTGGTNDGLFLAADTPILLRVSGEGASVGLEAITVSVASDPEPSSLLGLLGLAGLFAVKRRR